MIIYIWGEDTFRSRQYLKKTIEQFKKQRDPQGYNVVILDTKKEESGRVLSEILSVPFLAEKRMIVLENLLSTSDKELLSNLIERIRSKNLPETNVLVVWQGELFGKNKEIKELIELLQKEKYAQEFKSLEVGELSSWVSKEIAARGGKIGSHALVYLAQNTGKDMWLLNSLLDQLLSYKKGEEITLADAQLFLEEKEDDNIFNMVDAVAIGNKKQAFKLLEDQRKLGEDDTYLFSMILRQFRILLQLRDLFEREDKMTSDVLAKTLGLHPYVVKKSLPLVRKYPLRKLKHIYEELLSIDIKTKTGQGDQSMLLDLLVGKIST
jgi:DNA polymerase-3 subunit delta